MQVFHWCLRKIECIISKLLGENKENSENTIHLTKDRIETKQTQEENMNKLQCQEEFKHHIKFT